MATIAPDAAHAQAGKKPPAKDPKLAEAKQLFDQATEAYANGRYEDAVRDWEKSYELSGRALIFESIANAYERLGEKKKAREALAKWRDAAPPEEHEQLDAKLKALDERIAAADAAEKKRKEDEEKKRKQDDGAAKAEREARESARSTRLILAISAGGAGVLAVGAGVALGVVGSGQRPDSSVCTKAGQQTLCPTSARDAIEGSSTLVLAGDITWIAGAVLIAAGGALFFTLPSADPPAAQGGEKAGACERCARAPRSGGSRSRPSRERRAAAWGSSGPSERRPLRHLRFYFG
ncbi:MAG: hypothetical protein R3F14_26860 [Polyangiaceae bacterium]